MDTIPLCKEFKVTLQEPMLSSSGHKIIRVIYGGGDNLDISLRRTLRVTDNVTPTQLPPDCGPLPIYSVTDHESKLPKTMTGKGGLFVPMFEREAMWINLKSDRPFALKIYAGQLNAVSSEPQLEGQSTLLRRKTQLSRGKSIQDYIVSGSQLWLDGRTTLDGKVMQFVATPIGSTYSINAELRGSNSAARLQFEVMPTHRKPMCIYIQDLNGKIVTVEGLRSDTLIAAIKDAIQDLGILPATDQQLMYKGGRLEDGKTLSSYKLGEGSKILLMKILRYEDTYYNPQEVKMQKLRQKRADAKAEMTVASDVFIKQANIKDPIPPTDWDQSNTIMFNVQLLNASTFERMLDIKAPETPITPDLYKQYGFPWLTLYKELGGMKAKLNAAQTTVQAPKKRGRKRKQQDEEMMKIPVVELNTVDQKRPFLPVSVMEAILSQLYVA